jgi:hypothetical protein
MSLDDDITEAVVSGDAYEETRASVYQTISLPLAEKIWVAVGTLFSATPFWPLVALRRDAIRSIEGTFSFELALGVLVGLGVVITFCAGLLLLRQYYTVQTSHVDEQQARHLVHMEDMFTWFLLLGTALVVVPVIAATAGALSPETTDRLYNLGIRLYRPSERFQFDGRYAACLGGVFGVVLSGLVLWVRSLSGR